MKNKNRLDILHDNDIELLYSLPQFDEEVQSHYLALNHEEIECMRGFGSKPSQLYFALQLSYFKVKRQFFHFEFSHVKDDAKFLLDNYFNGATLPKTIPSKNTQTNIRKTILSLLNFNGNKKTIELILLQFILDLCRNTVNPKIMGEVM